MARSLPLQSLKEESTYEPPKSKPTSATIPAAVSTIGIVALIVPSNFPSGVGLHPSDVRSMGKLLTLLCPIRWQPQGDVGRLHRLPNHPHQVVVERLQVRFVTQLCRE